MIQLILTCSALFPQGPSTPPFFSACRFHHAASCDWIGLHRTKNSQVLPATTTSPPPCLYLPFYFVAPATDRPNQAALSHPESLNSHWANQRAPAPHFRKLTRNATRSSCLPVYISSLLSHHHHLFSLSLFTFLSPPPPALLIPRARTPSNPTIATPDSFSSRRKSP